MKNLETFADYRLIYEFAEENNLDFRELATNIDSLEKDFELDGFRFIHDDEIDQIQLENMESDAYMLGCFNADFISDNSDLSYDIVKALQDGEKYEELGQHLIDNDCAPDMQSEYSRLDGYGHHFATYDGNTIEELLDYGYYAFKN